MKLFLLIAFVIFFLFPVALIAQTKTRSKQQKIIIIMMDGFGEDYYRNSDMPTLNYFEKHGIYKVVPSLMPSVTNVNNTSICTGVLPEKHGITGNSFFNTASDAEEFMEDDSLVLAPTIFERAKKEAVRSILFSSKKKTIGLLDKGTDEVISPETASPLWIQRIGTVPSIYSREVNYWLMQAALYSIKNDPGLGVIYIHITDYPMHTWAPESVESKEHLNKIDSYIAQISKAAPDAGILITADHGVNHKNFCWDLGKACTNRNTPVKIAISPERDKYFKHHRGFGGTAYVYLKDQNDQEKVTATLLSLKGVEAVLTKKEAAEKFHLMPGRIGDLIVLGDKNTVFGDLDTESEILPATYRSHGSLYDANVPLFVYHALNAPAGGYFDFNYKLAAWLFTAK